MKLLAKSINIVLTLLFLIAAAFLVYVAVPYFGNKALIVRSGSMQPSIGVGDLVVVTANYKFDTPAPALIPKYKVGDVVAYLGKDNSKVLTTHRVANVQAQDGKILYQTKGDANNAPDTNLVTEDKILGKTTFKIAGLGKIFAVAKTKEGFLALVVAPAILVIIFEFFNIFREIAKLRRRKSLETLSNSTGSGNVLLRLLVPFVVGTMFFRGSFASYADTETSTGNVLEAAESFPSPVPLFTEEVLPNSSPSSLLSPELSP